MTVKHISVTDTQEISFICENCIVGTNKCSLSQVQSIGGSLIQGSDPNPIDEDFRLQKCLVKTCNNFFFKKSLPILKEKIPEKVRDKIKSEWICAAHYCHASGEPFKVSSKITRCIKTQRAYLQQNFSFENGVPITNDKFISKDQLVDEMNQLEDLSTENLLPPVSIITLHNQVKNA